jgi:hypothetical protein
MSFSMTKEQYRNRTKRVTRRLGWWNLRAGEICNGVEKAQGLRKGEKIVVMGQHEIISTRREMLCDITPEDVVLEGFPDMTPESFIQFFMKGHKCERGRFTVVNRIEFDYL